MMKKIKKYVNYINLCFLIGMITACSDTLNITPDGRLTMKDVWAAPDLSAQFMSNLYNNIPHKGRRYFWFDNYPIALSDEAWSNDDVEGHGAVLCYNGQASASLHPIDYEYHDRFDADYWVKYWQQIRLCNIMLENIDHYALNKEEDRERWRGEAYTLRAYFYLQLIKWYGPLPLVDTVLPTDFDYSKMRKATGVECCKAIVDDCEKALSSGMPWRITATDEKMRVTKAVAAAIRSEAALLAASKIFNENNNSELWKYAYEKNEDSFNQLISNGYELYTTLHSTNGEYPNAYCEYFSLLLDDALSNNPIDKETIWENDFVHEPYYYVSGCPLQSNYMTGDVPSQQLVDAYDMLKTGKPVLDLSKPYNDECCLYPNYNEGSGYNPNKPYDGRDPRFYATVKYDGSKLQVGDEIKTIETYEGGNCSRMDASRTHTRTGYYPCKYAYYRSSTKYAGRDGGWKYYRLGAVYLNLAEAAIEAGHIDEGLRLINDIRHRAGFSPSVDVTSSSQDEARLLVRHERQVELAWEEYRFFDMRRWTATNENLDNEKFLTGMSIKKKGLRKTYTRILIGTTDSSKPSKMSYEAKWHWLPIPAKEAALMETKTGVKWQNEGW